MLRQLAIIVALPPVLAMFAGCAGDGAPGFNSDGASAADALFIRVRVLDPELFPVPDVAIVIDGVGLQNTTDSNGTARLGPLEPGLYRVNLEREGYSSTSLEVDARRGSAEVAVTLEPISRFVPYHEVLYVVGSVSCGIYTIYACNQVDRLSGINVTNDRSIFKFAIPAPNLANLLHEMKWTPQTAASGEDMRIMFLPSPAPAVFAEGTPFYLYKWGRSPLRSWLVPGELSDGANTPFDGSEGMKYEAYMRPNPSNTTVPLVNVMVDQRVDNWFTFFYNRPGPESFTSLEDV